MLPGTGPPVREIRPNRYLVASAKKGPSWCLVLYPTHDGCRLVSRWRANWHLTLGNAFWILISDPGPFIMERKMLKGIKARAERAVSSREDSTATRSPDRESRFDFIWSLPSNLHLPALHAAVAARHGGGLGGRRRPVRRPAQRVATGSYRRSCCAPDDISVGFGMALAIPNPIVVSLITNALTLWSFCSPPWSTRPATSPTGSSPSTSPCPSTTWPW
jgi:hypothetical protein